jgi:hypothetical protein
LGARISFLFLTTNEVDLGGGPKNREAFRRAVGEGFFWINSLNFNLGMILGKFSRFQAFESLGFQQQNSKSCWTKW